MASQLRFGVTNAHPVYSAAAEPNVLYSFPASGNTLPIDFLKILPGASSYVIKNDENWHLVANDAWVYPTFAEARDKEVVCQLNWLNHNFRTNFLADSPFREDLNARFANLSAAFESVFSDLSFLKASLVVDSDVPLRQMIYENFEVLNARMSRLEQVMFKLDSFLRRVDDLPDALPILRPA